MRIGKIHIIVFFVLLFGINTAYKDECEAKTSDCSSVSSKFPDTPCKSSKEGICCCKISIKESDDNTTTKCGYFDFTQGKSGSSIAAEYAPGKAVNYECSSEITAFKFFAMLLGVLSLLV